MWRSVGTRRSKRLQRKRTPRLPSPLLHGVNMIAVTLLLLAQIAEVPPPACTSLEPAPPRASASVEEVLSRAEHETKWKYRKLLSKPEDAAHELGHALTQLQRTLAAARAAGDKVGEAEAAYSLAR